MAVDYIPTMGDYQTLQPFRYWCQKVLPLVYDDSLSYYELLCKVVDYLNKTMEDVETLHGDVEDLHDAYVQLQDWVNDYFDNLDVQTEINNKLDSMASDGSLTNIISPFIPDLVSGWLNEHITPTTPAIDDTLTISGAGADAKVTGDRLNLLRKSMSDLPYSLYDPSTNTDDKYLNASGMEQTQAGWSVTDYLPINQSAIYYIKTETTSNNVKCCFYTDSFEFVSAFKTDNAGYNVLVAVPTAKYVRFSILSDEVDDFYYCSELLIPTKEGSVTPELISDAIQTSSFSDEIITGQYYNESGYTQTSDNWSRTKLYPVNEGDVIKIFNAQGIYAACFDESRVFLEAKLTNNYARTVWFVVGSGVSFVGFNILNANLSGYRCLINDSTLGGRYVLPWLEGADSISIWKHKTYISHGDSITWQDGKQYQSGPQVGQIAIGYQTIFSQSVGLDSYNNQGKSGWSMGVVNGNGVVNTIMSIGNYSLYNLCTIACGTNDFKLNVPLGTLGVIGDTNFDDTTFYGAYRKSIEYILTNSPTIRLVLMTPLQRDNDGYDVNYVNSVGCKLIDYVNAVKALGQMYGLPVCDMYANSGFTKKTLNTYTIDGLHPNDTGYKRMGGYLTCFLNGVGN